MEDDGIFEADQERIGATSMASLVVALELAQPMWNYSTQDKEYI